MPHSSFSSSFIDVRPDESGNPALQYNLKTNINLDFILQSYFLPVENPDLASYNFFIRLKWSY